MAITNDIQLQQVIINDLNGIIDEVAGKLLNNLQDSIQTEVYDAGKPVRYKRQGMDGGIQGSFETSTAVTMGNKSVEAWIEQNPMSMKLDELKNIHTSRGNDVRSILADIIIEGNYDDEFYATDKYGFWREPRDFWEPFLKELDKNGNKFIEEAFRNRGIVYKKLI